MSFGEVCMYDMYDRGLESGISGCVYYVDYHLRYPS